MNPAGFLAAQAEGVFQPAFQIALVIGLFFAFCVLLVLAIGLLLSLAVWLHGRHSASPQHRPELRIVRRERESALHL